jgi:multisubunit Na+/H+ antiporter MnhB subunit
MTPDITINTPLGIAPESAALIIDALVCIVAVALGLLCVSVRDALGSVLIFVAMGTVMSVAWVRLDAADLALAEAALGAGITGALLIAAWSRSPLTARRDATPSGRRVLLGTVTGLLVAGVAVAGLWPLLDSRAGLAGPVMANLAKTGVSYPVTAVLVDFRSFDTLLEVGVLLASLVAVWRLQLTRFPFVSSVRSDVLGTYARVTVPALILLGAALLWRGAFAPGGAFQAGAIGAAALILAALTGVLPGWRSTTVRLTVCFGVTAFVAAGVAGGVLTGTFLNWPDAHAGAYILFVELGATVSIALTLALLVVGIPPGRGESAGTGSIGNEPAPDQSSTESSP